MATPRGTVCGPNAAAGDGDIFAASEGATGGTTAAATAGVIRGAAGEVVRGTAPGLTDGPRRGGAVAGSSRWLASCTPSASANGTALAIRCAGATVGGTLGRGGGTAGARDVGEPTGARLAGRAL